MFNELCFLSSDISNNKITVIKNGTFTNLHGLQIL